MKLIEADGKRLLRDAGIAVPEGRLFGFDDDIQPYLAAATYPLYVKAQLLRGRRGLAGLVRRVESQEEAMDAIAKIREMVGAAPCAGVLIEAAIPFTEEWIAMADFLRVGFSKTGGADASGMKTFGLDEKDVPEALTKLKAAMEKNDALSIEINPLAILADGTYVALDAKVELDDAAAFRHPEWSELRRLVAPVALDGDIAVILSGGGASLVALDALQRAGGRAANYVEMSGNPDPESVRAASRAVFSKPGIRAIWIAGSYANFTDIQATVNAALAAADDANLRVPVVIRRDGPNADATVQDATRWAKERGVSLRFDRADTDLDASARAVVAASKIV